MKYGIREICNVVFRAANTMKIGSKTFRKGQPVLFMDTAKTSTLEGAATSVYATGGRGNVRLVTWEGEKTLTFTVEDALLSPNSFAMLSGAGVVKGALGNESDFVHAHVTTPITVSKSGDTASGNIPANTYYIDLSAAVDKSDICDTAPIFIIATEADGSITGTTYEPASVVAASTAVGAVKDTILIDSSANVEEGTTVLVDYYVLKHAYNVTELQIDAEKFGGYFYVEADTLFRAQVDGTDYPANITLPNVKIQSNWTFSMAATGDPSTFSFTMDAMPGYTYFDKTRKVLCVIQVIEENTVAEREYTSVMAHKSGEETVLEGKEEDGGKEIYDNVPNTEGNTMRGYTKLGTSATWTQGTAYYQYNSSTHRAVVKYAASVSTTPDDWADSLAAGLYTKNA